MPELIASARLASGARAVAALLRQARGHALARNVAVQVTFDATRARTELRDGPDVLVTQPLPRGITFAALPARSRILFGALGSADNGTIELGAGTRRRRVIVNQRGRVRLQ